MIYTQLRGKPTITKNGKRTTDESLNAVIDLETGCAGEKWPRCRCRPHSFKCLSRFGTRPPTTVSTRNRYALQSDIVMASLFASPDIAALVAAFPPPLPTRNQPSLVRSNSGNGLLNSSTVLDRFRTLLETEPNRLRKADLPHRFGIERIDWLLECYDSLPRIRWSRDGGSLIPEPVWKRLINDLTIRCSKNFIGIKSYAKAENIEDLSAEDQARLIEGYSLEAISPQLGRHDETQDFDAYLASKKLVEKTRAEIQSSMAGPSDENVNISRIYSTIPTTVLKQLVKEIIPIDQLEFEGEDFIFVPASYYSTKEERLRS